MAAVLLGVPDTVIPDDTKTHWDVNKIGGSPDWMCPPLSDPRCAVCGTKLTMVVQVYCPLAGSNYHRTLYVFACLQKLCWDNSLCWKVFRTQLVDQRLSSRKEQRSKSPEDLWGGDADDWGEDDTMATDKLISMVTSNRQVQDPKEAAGDTHNSARCVPDDEVAESLQSLDLADSSDVSDETSSEFCMAEDLTLDPQQSALYSLIIDHAHEARNKGDSDKISPSQSDSGCIIIGRYIDVFAEPQKAQSAPLVHEHELLMEYQKSAGIELIDLAKGDATSKGGERYEKLTAPHGNQVFQKTQKRLALSPEQVLRYSYKGEEMFLDTVAPTPAPLCRNCGSPSVFELQLLPTIVNLLKLPGKAEPAVEFGTAHIYTCAENCWNQAKNFQEEHIVVYPDPDLKFFCKSK